MSVPGNLPQHPGPETVTRTALAGPTEPISSLTTEHPDPSPRELPAIAGYRIVRRLGGGGMGDVFEAVDEKLGVTFALKIVRADRAAAVFVDRFRQEMRSMMGLDHPNIARIYGHNEINGRPYFTMKFVRGGTLADHRKAYVNKPRQAVELMLKVIDAVEYLHRRDQVHRDLKPSNILLDESGEPFLSDFGLVKDLAAVFDDSGAAALSTDNSTSPTSPRPESATLTRTGGILGTYAYMSPEQARGTKGVVGPKSDIWALGVILYELLVGHRPAEENGSASAALSKVDPELARIINRCLSEDPDGRYGSAALLAADLRQWLRPAVPSRTRRKPAAIFVAAILFAGVVVTLAIIRYGDKKPKPEDRRAWAREELRAGRTVTLIDAQGNPLPGFQLLGGAGTAHAERDPAGWWRVDTTAETLAEFLDDPGIDSFTLTGEVRGTWHANIPQAGLFVAHRRIATPDGDWHFQLEHIYEECTDNYLVPPAPPGLPVPPPKSKTYKPVVVRPGVPQALGRRVVRLHGSQLADGPGENPEEFNGWEIGRDDPSEAGPWRQLGIRATGTTFSVSWLGKDEYKLPEIDASRLSKMQVLLRERPNPPLSFNARGGLGVYVAGGSASFRNLTVVPGPAP